MRTNNTRLEAEPPREKESSPLQVILRAPPLHRFQSKRLQNRRKPLAQWMRHKLPLVICAVLPLFTASPEGFTSPEPLQPPQLAKLTFDQRLHNSLPLEATFRDENGTTVKLADYFGKQPAILLLGYNSCPMLCSSVLNGVVKGLDDLKLTAGKDFSVIFLSIDPAETPALAAAKRRTYLRHYDRPGSERGWHFLTGEEPAIRRVAAVAGFAYAYDPEARQYAHPSGLQVVTPEGRISRYMFGVNFPATELDAALKAASRSQISSPIQQLLILCFHYNPITGKYGALIMNIVRAFGVVTFIALVALVFFAGKPRAAKFPPGQPAHAQP